MPDHKQEEEFNPPYNDRWSDREMYQFRMDFNTFQNEFRDHLRNFEVHAREEKLLTEQLLRAFPEQDLSAHRQYHEKMIKSLDEQTRFWVELRTDVAKKTVWGIMLTIGALVMAGIAHKLGIKLTP